ncbi:unnamed protein product [Protopolystoma xenopodis]|uniref:Uncharacterized protein n=1 Tax=Protopolystoma xenopodis TaxID=117903 RepID=A0A3S5BUR6_9PLAT|nr:unnamed protein product [Protopolystoma xenopodis]
MDSEGTSTLASQDLSEKAWYVVGWSEIIACTLMLGYYLLMVLFGFIGWLLARYRIRRGHVSGRPLAPVLTGFNLADAGGLRIKYTDDEDSM